MFDITRHRFKVITLILLSVVMVSCKRSLSTSTDNMSSLTDKDPVEHIEIMTFESFPIQVNVVARGYLPDNCTFIDDITEERSDNTMTVKITTVRQSDSDKDCIKGLKPFEEIIPLDVEGLLAGVYVVKVNGVSDSFELGMDNLIP